MVGWKWLSAVMRVTTHATHVCNTDSARCGGISKKSFRKLSLRYVYRINIRHFMSTEADFEGFNTLTFGLENDDTNGLILGDYPVHTDTHTHTSTDRDRSGTHNGWCQSLKCYCLYSTDTEMYMATVIVHPPLLRWSGRRALQRISCNSAPNTCLFFWCYLLKM